MTAPCPELNELLELMSRPVTDAGRRHVEECPSCRNRLALYGSFVEPPGIPAGADVADAERRLAEAFARRTRVGSPTPSVGPPPVRAAQRRWSLGWAPRPVLAFAVILLAGAIVLMRPWNLGPPGTGELRQDAASRPVVNLSGPVATLGGGLRLSWAKVPEADAYRVRVVGPDLAEILSRDVSEPSLELGATDLKVPAGAVLGWKVTALRAGDEIASSPMGTIRRP